MRYVFDTEFWERGSDFPIIPISIGIVAEDGRELYCVNREMSLEEINLQADWLNNNVIPHLYTGPFRYITRQQIATEILKLVGTDPDPEFWAYFADYDWVVFCQLFGTMVQLPRHFPMWCRDVKQLMKDLNVDREDLPAQIGTEHNALDDALWTRDCLAYLLKLKQLRKSGGSVTVGGSIVGSVISTGSGNRYG